jgi:hypothetical protein
MSRQKKQEFLLSQPSGLGEESSFDWELEKETKPFPVSILSWFCLGKDLIKQISIF